MKAIAQVIPAVVEGSRSRFSDYLELTKPRLNFLVLVTTLAGFYLGTRGSFNVALLLHTLFGTALVAAGASALNQWMEREADAKMHRTEKRPLPAGRLRAYEAQRFGIFVSTWGFLYLLCWSNPLACLLAAITWASYLFAYTPLKKRTAFNTAVGAVPGAIPPMIGWAAVRNDVSVESWVLFGVLFLWQFPHFLAIAWMYREDYARGGFRMLSFFDARGILTARYSAVLTVALVAVSLLPTALGLTGLTYFVGASLLGVTFLALSICCLVFGVEKHARRMFIASVIYLPLLLALMTLNKN